MSTNQLRLVCKHKFTRTTDSKHTLPVAGNVVDRQLTKALPNCAWVSDIT